ncbi:uncharacterized protein LOC129138325 [Pan troglodytes]|uniref:uncharacterized protein LOC129138325 n=1 Tax=Pan troglodytes TaxID=9598 RepID=UPI0023F55965|nr:uncharacterized protein LOC129138325 [Pan troglodytes]
MMLLIFICPALQNPHSAGRGATKASEQLRSHWRPQPPRRARKKGERGRGKQAAGARPSPPEGTLPAGACEPRCRVLGAGRAVGRAREGTCGKEGSGKAERHPPRESPEQRAGQTSSGPPALRSPETPGLLKGSACPPLALSSLWRPGWQDLSAQPFLLVTSRQVGPAFGCLWTVPVQARDPARVEAPGPTERGLPGLPALAADAAASSPLGRTRPSCPRPLGPPPLPGQGCGQASCCLIFSAIPFARLYLTRPTPPRRSLGHRILHIAASACPPCLRGLTLCLRLQYSGAIVDGCSPRPPGLK